MALADNPRKRGRESSPAAEERWRKLARTVPATLMYIGTSQSVIAHVDSALSRIHTKIVSGSRVSAGMSPTSRFYLWEQLNAAHHMITRLSAIHAEVGHVFVLCASRLGLQGGAPWQAWEGHRADAVRHAKDALYRLRMAGSHADAASDVLRVVKWSRGPLPLEAKLLFRRAVDDVRKARDALHDMNHAINLEFFDAWMVLKFNR